MPVSIGSRSKVIGFDDTLVLGPIPEIGVPAEVLVNSSLFFLVSSLEVVPNVVELLDATSPTRPVFLGPKAKLALRLTVIMVEFIPYPALGLTHGKNRNSTLCQHLQYVTHP
jgi:hypothetical protein